MENATPVPALSPAAARALNARVLDPAVAVRNSRDDLEASPLQPTAYIADSLLLRGLPDGAALDTRAELESIGEALGIRVDDFSEADYRAARSMDREVAEQTWTSRVTLTPIRRLDGTVDAWTLLQHALEKDAALAGKVFLEHVMSLTARTYGASSGMWGYVGGMWGYVGGMWGYVGHGITEYGPGFGGRTPVAFCSPDPRTLVEVPEGTPVVAILDTGLGHHPWFTDAAGQPLPGVLINPDLPGGKAGLDFSLRENPEAAGVVGDPLNGALDAAAGHGTFVAGIVRQRCPQATLMAIPVLDAWGLSGEHRVLAALNLLAGSRRAFNRGDPHAHRIDVVNLSMGYYHESPALIIEDSPLFRALKGLIEEGVEIVAAAGNDATTAPFLPAALAEHPDVKGLHSVGALNPDGRTVALFSNGGSWVTDHAVGAAVVSTVPTTLTGSAGPSVLSEDPSQPVYPQRTTIDPDTHLSGFALWSGTSFAAPHVAGDLAAALLRR